MNKFYADTRGKSCSYELSTLRSQHCEGWALFINFKSTNHRSLFMPRKKRARAGRPSALAQLSVSDLMAEIQRRQAPLTNLKTQRDALAGELERLDLHINDIE